MPSDLESIHLDLLVKEIDAFIFHLMSASRNKIDELTRQ